MLLMIVFCNRNSISLSVIGSREKTNSINKNKFKETDLLQSLNRREQKSLCDNSLPSCGQKDINVQSQQLWTGVHQEREYSYFSGSLGHLQ